MAHGLGWKLQRLRSMSPAELAWRLGQRFALARLARRAGQPPARLDGPPEGMRAAFERSSAALVPFAAGNRPAAVRAFDRAHPGESARIVERAEAVLAGRIELFARTYELGPDPRAWPWNRDPAGGPDVALDFGPTLDYRDPLRVGDARRAWELGRHGFLAPVAQAAWLTDDARYAHFVFAVLEAWSAACPPYRGIQWASALEFALRSLSGGFALALVARSTAGRAIEDPRWERVLATWAEQLRYVAGHDARHSSANNHRLGEAAGLAWGGLGLGFLPEAAGWLARGLVVLEECVLAQTTPDGVTREHAFAYQQFVLDFAVTVEAAAGRAGRPLPPAVRERIARMADALDWLSPGGTTWPVGDGDEGQAFPLGEPYARRTAASLEAAARLTGASWSGECEPRSWWLGLAENSSPAVAGPERGGRVTRGGYRLEAWATPWGGARLLFDAAEMGLPPLYAHGHADALMLLLDVGGPRLVDPGTGAYHARPALREALRATAAHNTVELDGRSQSTPGGLFQWLRVARIIEPDDDGAAHDGWARDGVIHRRAFTREAADRILVVDRLEPLAGGAGGVGRVHRAVVRWHVGDGRAELAGVESGAARAGVRWPDGFTLALVARLPSGGSARVGVDATWAPRFLEPRPCGVVEWMIEGRLPLVVETTIVLGAGLQQESGQHET
ncbi:MAG: alginate lyase family protein [Candidatus Eisenbacteria bacterium]